MARHADVLVIGGGAAGLTAAREARRRKATVILVEAGKLGGDCTHTGCVPSKALLAAAGRGASFDEAMASVRRAVDTIAATEDAGTLRGEGIGVIEGWATLRSPREVDVGGERITADRVILATGASPIVPGVPGLRELEPRTNETLFSLPVRPDRLAVLGGGAIGCEMAQAFARLGCRVTVIEAEDRLLSREEPEASACIDEALRADGVDVRVGRRLEQAEGNGGAALTLSDGAVVQADEVLVAIGRTANTAGFGLEDVGVDLDERGNVNVDATLRTSVKGIWAVGDVTGQLPFTHVAARHAFIAVRNALSPLARARAMRFDPAPVPWVTYTSPEVGRVGMTEAEAAEHGAQVAFLPLDAVDRAIAAGATNGFVKLIAGPRAIVRSLAGGRIVGATVVAPTGGELIHEPALAMRTGMLPARLAQTVHAYPSWSMAVQQAAGQFFLEVDGRRARPARHD